MGGSEAGSDDGRVGRRNEQNTSLGAVDDAYLNASGFDKMAKKAFDSMDLDGSKSLDYKECYAGVLTIFDKLNSKLPAHAPPPKFKHFMNAFKQHDVSGDGKLDFEEFKAFAKTLMASRKTWKDSLVLRIILFVALQALLAPFIAEAIHSWHELSFPGQKFVSIGILAAVINIVGKFLLGSLHS